jgi:hypothetical protein
MTPNYLNSDVAREREAANRAHRLRVDWYTREALLTYLTRCTPLTVGREDLLARYDYLDHVPSDDFRWGEGKAESCE